MAASAAVVSFPLPASAPRPVAVTQAEGPARPDRAFVRTDGGRRIAYARDGEGPDVVLVHGTLMTADDMRLGPMPVLARRHRCTAFDRPGHGWSDHRRGVDGSLWGQMEVLREAVRALGIRRPVICGHSFGGAVALAYAMAHPGEIAGAVALAPVCFPEPRMEQALFGARAWPLAGDALSHALGAALDPVLLPLLWRAMFLPQPMPAAFAAGFPFGRAGRPEQIVAEAESALSLWPDLARSATGYTGCRAPVRILCGTADLVVNGMAHGATAAFLIPGARLDWLPGLGHMLHHARPAAVADAVAALLEG